MLRPPGVALSTAACSVAALGNGGYGGDMAGGEELSAPVDIGASKRKSARGGRGSTQQLTADRTKGLVSSGASSLLRIERRRFSSHGDEDSGDGGVAARPWRRGLSRKSGTSRRSSQAQRGVEGETVAAALRWHGCGCARAREGEGAEEGKSSGESESAVGAAWRRPGRC